jgi:phospholipase/carboxylesterase
MEKSFRSSIERYYDVELPSSFERRKKWPVLLAMHGYEGDKDSMMRIAKFIGDDRMVVVSLQAPFQFFRRLSTNPKDLQVVFGWGTTYKMEDSIQLHHRDLETMIAIAVRKYRADPKKVFLLGFSQPCAANYRYIFSHPSAIRGAVAVCGGVPGDWDTNPTYHPAPTAILHIAARKDEWYSREKNHEIRKRLRERVAQLDFRFYDSTHKFPRQSLPQIRRWIQQHL